MLLPCPFCGRSDKLRLMFTNWRLRVNCYACGIDGPSVNMSDGEAAAKEAWNHQCCDGYGYGRIYRKTKMDDRTITTTITQPASLVRKIKLAAAESGQSVSAWLADAASKKLGEKTAKRIPRGRPVTKRKRIQS